MELFETVVGRPPGKTVEEIGEAVKQVPLLDYRIGLSLTRCIKSSP